MPLFKKHALAWRCEIVIFKHFYFKDRTIKQNLLKLQKETIICIYVMHIILIIIKFVFY